MGLGTDKQSVGLGAFLYAFIALFFGFIFTLAISVYLLHYVFTPIYGKDNQTLPADQSRIPTPKHSRKLQILQNLLPIGLLLIILIGNFLTIQFFIIQPYLHKKAYYALCRSQPISHLFYPGAMVFTGETFVPASEQKEIKYTIFLSYDQEDKIYQWYENWLINHGWKKAELYGLTLPEKSAELYKREKNEYFRVSIYERYWAEEHNLPNDVTVFGTDCRLLD